MYSGVPTSTRRLARDLALDLFPALATPKSSSLRLAVARQHEVLGLDVPVHDAGAMRRLDRA